MTFKFLLFSCLALNAVVFAKDVRIIGGADANLREFPYQASLTRISDDEHICGGAIISTLHILTTAHCVDIGFVIWSNLKIRTGISKKTSLRGATHLPERIFTHPKYTGTPNSMTHNLYDIAVIRVQRNIEFNEFQKKILLPVRGIFNDDMAKVSGWGATGNPPTKLAETLQAAWMHVLDIDHCKPIVPFDIHADQFCAFQQPGVGVCNGDGGSPLVSEGRIIGLVVASRPYATGEPEIYVDVFKHNDFIKSIIK